MDIYVYLKSFLIPYVRICSFVATRSDHSEFRIDRVREQVARRDAALAMAIRDVDESLYLTSQFFATFYER